ncbi:MAG: hypothetical protein KJO43_16435 [Phycisphaerae bacterium]|nr:hypothetical protein [Phycisphaerae bacterium]
MSIAAGVLLLVALGSCVMPMPPGPPPPPLPLPPSDPSAADTASNLDAPPLFWSWQRPLGRPARSGPIIQMVRKNTARLGPAAAADRVCDEIIERRLQTGQVAILLQNFGMGDGDPDRINGMGRAPALYQHWCDGLAHRARGRAQPCERLAAADEVPQWWMTVWMKHGIAESRAYMDAFIARYRQRQASDRRVPDPTRFHFDTEGLVVPQKTASGTVKAFDAMRRDPRWQLEPVPGFDGRSLETLYEEAGRPACDPAGSWQTPGNRRWSVWYAGVCMQAADAAMNDSAYRRIRAAWPTCMSSNYRTSSRTDGAGDPPRVIIPRGGSSHRWFTYHHRAFGDLQAPELYWVHPSHRQAGESAVTSAVREARQNVDALIHSFGGPHLNITPWIELVGDEYTAWNTPMVVPPALNREMLAMLRRRGIREFILWSNDSTQRNASSWNAFVMLADQVWSTSLTGVEVERGTALGAALTDLEAALRDPFRVQSTQTEETGAGRFATRLRTSFHLDRARLGLMQELVVVLESWIDRAAGTTMRLFLRDWSTDSMTPLRGSAPGQQRVVERVATPDANRFIDPDGRIELVIEHRGPAPFTIAIDAVQMYPAGP